MNQINPTKLAPIILSAAIVDMHAAVAISFIRICVWPGPEYLSRGKLNRGLEPLSPSNTRSNRLATKNAGAHDEHE